MGHLLHNNVFFSLPPRNQAKKRKTKQRVTTCDSLLVIIGKKVALGDHEYHFRKNSSDKTVAKEPK